MKRAKYIGLGLAIALSLGFSGCSGGGGGGTATVTGQFIDAPVEGLSYECSSGLSGITDSKGTFTCNKDDNVTFKIGNLILGSSAIKDVITPLHLYTNTADIEKVYNVSQILHSLDNDANPDNNIQLDAALLSTISLSSISIDADSNTFQNALASSLASAGKTAYDRAQAKAKMYSNINSYVSATPKNYNTISDLKNKTINISYTSTDSTVSKNIEYKLVKDNDYNSLSSSASRFLCMDKYSSHNTAGKFGYEFECQYISNPYAGTYKVFAINIDNYGKISGKYIDGSSSIFVMGNNFDGIVSGHVSGIDID